MSCGELRVFFQFKDTLNASDSNMHEQYQTNLFFRCNYAIRIQRI